MPLQPESRRRKTSIGMGWLMLLAAWPLATTAGEATAPVPPSELVALEESESKITALLGQLDTAIETIEAAVVDYLQRADAADSLAQRQAMEELAVTANRQLGELQAQRATLATLHAELRAHIEAATERAATD